MRFAVLPLLIAIIVITSYSPISASAVPPSNDDFETAARITDLPFSDSVDTTDADDGGCFFGEDGFCQDQYNNTVWYTFAPLSQEQNVEISTEGSDYDTVLCYGTRLVQAGSISTSIVCVDNPGGQENIFVKLKQEPTMIYLLIGAVGGSEGGNAVISVNPIDIELKVNPTAKLDESTGQVTISGTVACNPELNGMNVFVGLVQTQKNFEIREGSSLSLSSCDSETPWSITLAPPLEGEYRLGRAEVEVAALEASLGSAGDEVIRNIAITPKK
jgi:hypothetical protein